MKKVKTLILLLSIVFGNHSLFAESSALEDLLTEKSNLIHDSEKNSEALSRLNEEKKLLIDKLVDLNKQYDDVMRTHTNTQKTEIDPVTISTQEIAKYIAHKRVGRCKFSSGEYPGEYIIQKEKVKIRFTFLPRDSALAPKLTLVKSEQNEELLQVEQPGYDPNARNLKGDIYGVIRFLMNPGSNKPGEIVHAVFMGQRLGDKWFGQSSYALTTVSCVLGQNLSL